MPKTFLTAFVFSAIIPLIIFVTTMLNRYRGIDYPYLIYAATVIFCVSITSAFISSNIVKNNRMGASILSVAISFGFYIFLVFLNS